MTSQFAELGQILNCPLLAARCQLGVPAHKVLDKTKPFFILTTSIFRGFQYKEW